ncbi:MAG: hypothetical protein ACJ8GO_18200 [Ramlibacter sp.]
MIPAPLDPSLQSAQPAPPQLDDGFSPPSSTMQGQDGTHERTGEPVDPALWAKSDF